MSNAPSSTPDVTVAIVTYNSIDNIDTCLSSLSEAVGTHSVRTVILDNLSKDHTVAHIRERYPRVELIESKENLGFAKGVNKALEDAHTSYVLLLNPDTELKKECLDELLGFAVKHPEYQVYGGRTLKSDGKLEPHSCLGRPTYWSLFCFATCLSTLFKDTALFDPETIGGWHRDTVREVDVISGCFMLVETRLWRRLGGLDTRYFMYGEDADFCVRARQHGAKPVIVPGAQLVHELGKSSAKPTHKLILLFKGKVTLNKVLFGKASPVANALLYTGVLTRAVASIPGCVLGKSKWNDRWLHLIANPSKWIGGY